MEERVARKLTAILAADVVGYSRLMDEDEEATLHKLKAHRQAIDDQVEQHQGRIFGTAGDGLIAEFASPVQAVRCAIAVQQEMAQRNGPSPHASRMDFRIGINLGDVMIEGSDLFGDGVNIASRLEGLAEPGGICISGTVFDQIKGKIDQDCEFLGEQSLKNIAAPVRAYRVLITVPMPEKPTAAALEFAPPDRPSIAILPFKGLGADPDKDYIADGLRFGISASLVQLSGLFLVHAPALNPYRGQTVAAATVGMDLNARYVLEGAVQQAGNRIRVTVQLTDSESGQVILAESYDRVLDDVFKMQDEITREIITTLNIELVANEIDRVWFTKLESAEAKEFYYRGASHFYELNKEDNATARHYFEELTRVQPDSVVGPSYVCVSHWMDGFFEWSDSPAQSLQDAAEWARRAMEYDDNNGIGHAVFGHLQLMKGDHEGALANCSTGVKLRTSCPLAHALLGLVLNFNGEAKAAVRSTREALQLEKVYPTWLIDILAAAYRDSGAVDQSIVAAQESLRLHPKSHDARLILCSSYQRTNQNQKARQLAQEIMESNPDFTLSGFAKSQPYKDPVTLEGLIDSLRAAGLPS